MFYLQLCRVLKPPPCVGWRGSSAACWWCGWPILDSTTGGCQLCYDFLYPMTSSHVFWCFSAVGIHKAHLQSVIINVILELPWRNYQSAYLPFWNLSSMTELHFLVFHFLFFGSRRFLHFYSVDKGVITSTSVHYVGERLQLSRVW